MQRAMHYVMIIYNHCFIIICAVYGIIHLYDAVRLYVGFSWGVSVSYDTMLLTAGGCRCVFTYVCKWMTSTGSAQPCSAAQRVATGTTHQRLITPRSVLHLQRLSK